MENLPLLWIGTFPQIARFNPPKYAPMAPMNYHYNIHHLPCKNYSLEAAASSLSNCFKPRHFWPMVLEAAPSARPYTIGIFRWKAFQELCMDPRKLIRRFPAHIRDLGWRNLGPQIIHPYTLSDAKGGLLLVFNSKVLARFGEKLFCPCWTCHLLMKEFLHYQVMQSSKRCQPLSEILRKYEKTSNFMFPRSAM